MVLAVPSFQAAKHHIVLLSIFVMMVFARFMNHTYTEAEDDFSVFISTDFYSRLINANHLEANSVYQNQSECYSGASKENLRKTTCF